MSSSDLGLEIQLIWSFLLKTRQKPHAADSSLTGHLILPAHIKLILTKLSQEHVKLSSGLWHS